MFSCENAIPVAHRVDPVSNSTEHDLIVVSGGGGGVEVLLVYDSTDVASTIITYCAFRPFSESLP